jgi:hypothetical protein
MEWISVNDRLPEENTEVLGVESETNFFRTHVIMCKRLSGLWLDLMWFDEIDGYQTANITHWMPLPPPPTVTK